MVGYPQASPLHPAASAATRYDGMNMRFLALLLPLLLQLPQLFQCSALLSRANAESWATYRGDDRRSGVAEVDISTHDLALLWQHQLTMPPRPAWDGPARWDAFNDRRHLPSMRNYDLCYHPVAKDGTVYIASSADDCVYAFDESTGELKWRFATGGPVRMAPTIHQQSVLVGSDDGRVYSLGTESGQLQWSFCPREHQLPHEASDALHDHVLNDGRLISLWPVRTGVLVHKDQAIFAASLLPWEPSYLCSIDVKTGKTNEAGFVKRLNDHTFEGAMAIANHTLIAPQGRIAPKFFSARTGKFLGSPKTGGGTFAIITPEQKLVLGNHAEAKQFNPENNAASLAVYRDVRSVVIGGGRVFRMTSDRITCRDHASQETLWSQPIRTGNALALAKNAVIVGTASGLNLYRPETGQLICTAKSTSDQRGRPVHGIAITEAGQIIASTESGTLLCFGSAELSKTAQGKDFVHHLNAPSKQSATNQSHAPELPTLAKGLQTGLISRWVPTRKGIEANNRRQAHETKVPKGLKVFDQTGDQHGRLRESATIQSWPTGEALELAGTTSIEISTGATPAWLPRNAFTALAWVRLRQGSEWGGVISAVRDNGNDEQGWVLGYRRNKLAFGIKQSGTKTGVRYCIAPQDFQSDSWHQVAGVFDGRQQSLYVDGKLVTQLDCEAAGIQYPDTLFVTLGAFHDEDEHHRMKGMLGEARIYDRPLTATEVATDFNQLRTTFPAVEPTPEPKSLRQGPIVQFLTSGQAAFWGQTHKSVPTGALTLKWKEQGSHQWQIAALESDSPFITATLTDLRPRSLYDYAVFQDDQLHAGPWLLDTHFSYAWQRPHGAGTDSPASAPASPSTDFIPGLGQVLESVSSFPRSAQRPLIGIVGNDVATAIAVQTASQSQVVMLCPAEPKDIIRIRQELAARNLSGHSIAAMPLSGDAPEDFVNVLITRDHAALETAWRHVRPDGGVAIVCQSNLDALTKTTNQLAQLESSQQLDQHSVLIKGKRRGAADWTHMYGGADNSHFTGETLSDANQAKDLKVQWLGRPGPRHQSDRENRKPSPLYADGRLFIQGHQRILALDGHNGTIQWTREIPEMARFNIPRDCSNWCTDGKHLYLAIGDRCWTLDCQTGQLTKSIEVPDDPNADGNKAWGYVSMSQNQLIGSVTSDASAFTDWYGKQFWYDSQNGALAAKVVSSSLFAIDPASSKRLWTFQDTLILNSTITIAGDHVFFCQARAPENFDSSLMRLQDAAAWDSLELVAVDRKTGKEHYRTPLPGIDLTTSLSVTASEDWLIVSGSAQGRFEVLGIKQQDGSQWWRRKIPWEADHHGKHLSRPAIANGKVFLRPVVLQLATGETLDALKFPGGHTCASYTLTARSMFLRAGSMTMWTPEKNQSSKWNRLRTDCWISHVPAGGMLLMPEGGGGCSCGGWLETSMGFRPDK